MRHVSPSLLLSSSSPQLTGFCSRFVDRGKGRSRRNRPCPEVWKRGVSYLPAHALHHIHIHTLTTSIEFASYSPSPTSTTPKNLLTSSKRVKKPHQRKTLLHPSLPSDVPSPSPRSVHLPLSYCIKLTVSLHLA